LHFHECAKTRLAVERTNYSNPWMHINYRSCSTTVLLLPTHTYGEAIIKTSKICTLFIQYPNSVGILLRMGIRPI
jgi:hypothetical protein